ncbi:aminotransferase class V-fold PLP-dependent enzyme, partial [Brunnivagina elsteri]
MNLLQKIGNIQIYEKRFQIYPRLQLDISYHDLINSLFSFGHRIEINESLNSIKSFFPVDKEIVVTFSVRTAFDLLLQSLNFATGSEVLMSAITIKNMIEIIKINGLIPVSVDISLQLCEPSLEQLEKSVSGKTKVLLITHLFGTVIDLHPYVEFCQKHNLILIEDCAQAFAGSEYYGHPQADISFFSFGSIKSSTALGGGVTLIKNQTQNQKIAENIQELHQQYPQKTELWFLIRVWKYLLLKTLSIPWVYYLLLQTLNILSKDLDSTINATTRGFAQGNLLAKIRYRPPHHLVYFIAYRLTKCEESKCQDFSDRIETAQNFLAILQANIKNIIFPGIQANYHSFWLFPIIVKQPELLMVKLRSHNFDVTRGTTSLTVCESPRNSFNYPSLENAKYLMEHILFLPISSKVPKIELE